MAYDLLSGKLDERDWSRGDGVTEFVARRATGSLEKQIQWMPDDALKIAAGIGIATVGLLFFLPSSKKAAATSSHHQRRTSRPTEPTLAIPHESMHDVVHGRRK